MKNDVIHLAIILYADLPFWKRWKIRKFYVSNNWDVTDQWTKCVKAARKMIADAEFTLEKYDAPKVSAHKSEGDSK